MTRVEDRPDLAGPAAHVLDTPVWSSLTGPHSLFAEGTGQVRRYPPDVSPFAAVAPDADTSFWPQLHALVGDGAEVALTGVDPALLDPLPPGWQWSAGGEGVQLVATDRLFSAPDAEARRLGADDVPEMLDLVRRTDPGPFLPRTIDLGTYLGIRREGRLVAMAGERMHPPGWTEISGVSPRSRIPCATARTRRLYLALGFELRRRVLFTFLRSPSGT